MRNTDGNGVPVFGARMPPRSESGGTGIGTSLLPTRVDGGGSPTLRADSVIGVSLSVSRVVRPSLPPSTGSPGSGVRPANRPGVPPAAAIAPSKPSGANAARSRNSPRASPTGQSHVASVVVGGVVACARTTDGAAAIAAHATIVTACLIIRDSNSEAGVKTLQSERSTHASLSDPSLHRRSPRGETLNRLCPSRLAASPCRQCSERKRNKRA